MPAPSIASSTQYHTSHQDDAYDVLSLGRTQGKRRKYEGLNTRLDRMLQRLNTSFAANSAVHGNKRPRNPSHGSSSSTLASEPPQTPIDVIHSTAKSDYVGEGFALIKAGSPPDKNRSDNFLNNILPSWRAVGRQNSESRANCRQELPNWLSDTFATLEADHPLRALAFPENTSTLCNNAENSENREPSSTAMPKHLEESRNDPVFAFTPPQIFSPGRRVSDENAANKIPASLPVDDINGKIRLPSDGFAYADAKSELSSPVPFAQPGPFAQKSVHFLTPVRSPPFSTNVPSNGAKVNSDVSYGKHPRSSSPDYNPFSTPGPAASFSLSHFDGCAANSDKSEDYNYDSPTLVSETNVGDELFADGDVDEDAAASILSFASNSEHVRTKPFSTPGPTFFGLSDLHAYSPPEELWSSDLTPLMFQDEQPLPAGRGEDDEKLTRFVELKHEGMAGQLQQPADIISSKRTALELGRGSPPNQLNNNVMDVCGLEQSVPTFALRSAGAKTDAPDVIEILRSSPSMQRNRLKVSSDQTPHTSYFKQSIPRTEYSETPASPYLLFESPRGSARPARINEKELTVPEVPSQLQTLFDHTNSPSPKEVHVLSNRLDNESGSSRLIVTPRPTKNRPAFAPAPGIYISPIYDGSHQKYGDITQLQGSARSSSADRMANEAIWNINASQLSDDPIEDWEI